MSTAKKTPPLSQFPVSKLGSPDRGTSGILTYLGLALSLYGNESLHLIRKFSPFVSY